MGAGAMGAGYSKLEVIESSPAYDVLEPRSSCLIQCNRKVNRITIENTSSYPVIVFVSGDTFSLATIDVKAAFGSDGVSAEVSGEVHRAQLDKESPVQIQKVSNGSVKVINFHANQSNNYVSLAFSKADDDDWHFVCENVNMMGGAKIVVKAFPEQSAILKTIENPNKPAREHALTGTWKPTRQGEWYSTVVGKHSDRARNPMTVMTVNSDGSGNVNLEGPSVIGGPATFTLIGHGPAYAIKRVFFGQTYNQCITLNPDGTAELHCALSRTREFWKMV